MPGLGGKALSRENALETADALNQIDADFIRIRTLAIPEVIELHRDVEAGNFKPLGDKQKAEEQKNIDAILDKISKGGYDSLTAKEKEQLFKASNKK